MPSGLANSRWARGTNGRPNNSYSSTRFASTTTITTIETTVTNTRASSLPATPRSIPSTAMNGFTIDASALSRIPTPAAELARYTKIVRRLKWKLPYLADGYRQATDRAAATSDGGRARMAEAELMFKLDFFEYYSMLERALVHLLGVFGISVSGGFSAQQERKILQERQARARNIENGSGNGWQQSDHRFHANVLEALDNPDNPLHEVLGRGSVRHELARAKELRNRWKNADDVDGGNAQQAARNARAARPLEDYDLERILETAFDGFDRGFMVAENYAQAVKLVVTANGMVSDEAVDASSENEEASWEFMTDAMDWEAV